MAELQKRDLPILMTKRGDRVAFPLRRKERQGTGGRSVTSALEGGTGGAVFLT